LTAPDPPLAGTVVLSAGHTLPGLTCLALLRDLGALVVRIERPRSGADAGPYAALGRAFPTRSLSAGTSELALDLKTSPGRAAFERLALAADAVLEGFRPGVAARLGIDYPRLSARHPELVYASISGYGQHGPWSQRVGHDVNYLAETGALQLGNPLALPGVPFADGLAGLAAALNVVAALHAAGSSGRGLHLDLAIVDGPLFLMASELEHYWSTGESRRPGDTHLCGRHPWYNVHATADGSAVAVGAVEPPFHAAWCRGLGRPDLASRQHAGGQALEAAWEATRAALAGQTRDEVVARFEGEEGCVSPVLRTSEVAASPLLERFRRDGAAPGEVLVRSPVRTTPAALGPELRGAELLARFGFSADEIDALERAGPRSGS
jgi:crotonobetainyl-CoA:carnitine CoA-transferase CaiB-like acyl-CoA transferase